MTPDEIAHRVRTSVFAREVEWRLAGDRLVWKEIGDDLDADARAASGAIALDQVESVRLTCEPGRRGARMFCRLRTRDGATALIGSAHHAGVLRAHDRSASYRPLARELVARIAAGNGGARFLGGATPFVWWGTVLGLAALFGGLGALFVLAGREMFTTRLALGLTLIAVGAPNLIGWLKANRPGTFDPADPPL